MMNQNDIDTAVAAIVAMRPNRQKPPLSETIRKYAGSLMITFLKKNSTPSNKNIRRIVMPLPEHTLHSTEPMIFEVLADNDWRRFLCREYQIPRIARGLESKGLRIRGWMITPAPHLATEHPSSRRNKKKRNNKNAKMGQCS
ncbi:hypothetical protein ACWX0P_17565 [Vibrio mediterranei]